MGLDLLGEQVRKRFRRSRSCEGGVRRTVTGHVSIAQMMRAGFALNLLAVGVIALVIRLLLPWLS